MKSIKRFPALALLIMMLAFSTSYGQHITGARAGLNVADMHGTSVIDNKMIMGYNVDLFYAIPFESFMDGKVGELMGIQGEVNVETKGTNSQYVLQIMPEGDSIAKWDTANRKQNFTYVSFPVFLKFKFGDKRYMQYYLGVGGYGASLFGLTIDGEVERDEDFSNITKERKYREEYSGFDFGAIVAAGFVKPIGGRKSSWAITGDIRYTYGFNNVGQYRNKPDIPENQLSDIKTNTLSVSFGVVYKIANFSF